MNKIHSKNNTGIQKAFVDIDESICFYDGDRIYEEAVPDLDNINKIIVIYSTTCVNYPINTPFFVVFPYYVRELYL